MRIPGCFSLATPWAWGIICKGWAVKGVYMDEGIPLCRHYVSVSLAQLSATIFRKEGLQGWPQFMNLLQHSTHSSHSPEKEVWALPCWQEGGSKAR